MKRISPRIPLLLAAAVALIASGCGSSNSSSEGSSSSASGGGGNRFRVGLEAPLSGEQAVLGRGMLRGAQLAASQLNEAGGIEGRDVQIVSIDDAADPETGVKAAKSAIAAGLDGVVGPYNSGVGVETLPLYLKAGLVPIRLTSDTATNGMGYTLQPMTYQIAPVAAGALTQWLHARSVAIAYDPTQIYTVTVSKTLKKLLENSGVKVTAYEKVKPGAGDYSDLVKKLETGKPDVVYAAVYFPEGGLIAKEMMEAGTEAQCVADYASYDTGFVETAGVAAARTCPVVGVPAPDDFPGSASHVADYRKRFGEAPGTWSPYTFDSLRFLAAGVERAGGTDPKALEKALSDLAGFKGWTGPVSIDPSNGNRDPATVVIAETDASGDLHVDHDWARATGAPY